MAGHGGAGFFGADRAQGDRGHRRQDRRVRGQGGRQRALRVAVLGSLTSTIGNTLTGLFETAFQVIPGIGALPAELSTSKRLMFGNRLIRETGNVVFQDPAFRTDLVSTSSITAPPMT